MPLTKSEIKALWNVCALYIEWGDGTDSLCQENGYTLEFILNCYDQGYNIYKD